MIKQFRKEYRFLSNFAISPYMMDGYPYSTVEHGFQAAKAEDLMDAMRIRNAVSCSAAKKLGRQIKIRFDWEDIKLDVMFNHVLAKFTCSAHFRMMLLATRAEELQEGNNWGDTYWGVCEGKGENHLGRILMQIRGLLNQVRHESH